MPLPSEMRIMPTAAPHPAPAERLLIACGTDALSNVLKEFWPDVKHWYQTRKHKDVTAPAAAGTTSAR